MNSVRSWLEGLGLGDYAAVFEANRIDVEVLPHLTEQDLVDLGLPIGPRRKVIAAICSLGGMGVAEQPDSATTVDTPIGPERRHLTVLFCDLVESTALSAALDAEDLRNLMQAYQQAAGAVIARYQGHVAQYLGDGLMTYFGWPAAHEDDAERAVRAGLEIVDAVKAVTAPAHLRVRIGIASGPVVVGETGGGDASVPKLAVGETPNLAARMQALAAADEIVITASTRRLIGAVFELDPLGEHLLKGIAQPVSVWRVTGIAVTEGRFEVVRSDRLTPLVGREAEIAMIMQRWQQAKDGEGQVVLLCGEPGIGKSRVTQVMRESVADEPHTWLRWQCSPFHSNSALYPIIEQFQHAAGFDRGDNIGAKLDKMEALLRIALDDITAVAPLFAALLSLDAGTRYQRLELTPQAQKDETLKAIAGRVEALAATQPLLMIFEDVHWIDPTTQEALDVIVPAIAGQRVLVLITYRPEHKPLWSGLAHVTVLALTRLARKQAAVVIQKVAGGNSLPKEVVDQIIVKTDGVPLFVEELTKAVLESGLIKAADNGYSLVGPLTELAIPSTLRDSLMARLDRLGSVREVAQIGACIGRQFSRDLLALVSPLGAAALEDALRQLVAAELVFRTGIPANASYMFKHALVQDAAYSSLLKSRRQMLHRQIAEALLSHFPELIELAPETLAHHYTEGAVFDKAAGYWGLAADRASARFANTEAIEHSRRGLATLDHVADEEERCELELRLRLGLIATLRMSDRHNEALEELDRAESLAAQNKRTVELSRIHHLRGNIYFPLGKFDKCLAEHQAACKYAREARSTEDEARALGGLADAYYMRGRMRSAHEHVERCVELCRAHGFVTIETANLPLRAATHMFALRFTAAWEDCRSAVEMAEKVGHPRAEIVARGMCIMILLERHDFARAQEHARRTRELVEKIGARRFVPICNHVIAQMRLHAGDRAGAIEILEASLAISRETGVTFWGPIVLAAIAVASDDPRRRQEAMREGQAILDRGCVGHNYFFFYRDAIEVSLNVGDWRGVEGYVTALHDYFRDEPTPWSDFIIARGRVLAELGRGSWREPMLLEMQRLRDQAAHLDMRVELSGLQAALKSTRPA